MRKKIGLFSLLFGLYFFASANDGVFYAQGNHIIPVKETVVKLQKEVLKLKRMGDYMLVDVYFEFMNPGPEKTEIVGFVTPPAMGDVDDSTAQHPQIRDFSVVVNQQSLKYKIAQLENTGFKLSEEAHVGNDFVYYFDVTFKPGLNTIHHQYQFRGGSSVDMDYSFDYRLTTGTMWANGEIEDFTLEIDMGERALFTLPWSFQENGAPANWTLLGTGKMGKKKDMIFEIPLRSTYTHAGSVQFKSQHFRPELDLGIFGFRVLNQANCWGRPDLSDKVNKWVSCILFCGSDGECLHDLSVAELRIMRNYFYARQGLAFKSKDLTDYFSQFIWYDPIAGLKAEDIKLDEWEQESLKAISTEEKLRIKNEE